MNGCGSGSGEPDNQCRENLHQDRRRWRDRPVRRHARVKKSDPRVAAYGDVDELNAWLGFGARRVASDADAVGHARADPARPVRARRAARRSRPQIADRVTKAAVTREDISAARGLDRRARSGAAAAAPVHPRRRLARRRGAARRAHDLPPRRARDGRRSAPDAVEPELLDLRQPAVGPAVRHGAGREPSRGRAGSRVVSGRPAGADARARLRAMRAPRAREHYENFPVASLLLPAPCARTSPPSTRSRGAPTTSPTSRAFGSRAPALLDDWQRRLHASISRAAERCRASRTASRRRFDLRRARTHDSHRHGCRRRCSTICSARSARTCRRRATRRGTTCSTIAAGRPIPVGRLVLRVAGYDDAGSTSGPTRSARRFSSTNFWQDFGVDWRRGRLYVPDEDRDRARARRSGSRRGADDAGVADGAATPSSAARASCSTPGGGLRRRQRPAALGAAPDLARRVADPRQVKPLAFDVLHRRPTLSARGRSSACCATRLSVWRLSASPWPATPTSTTRSSCSRRDKRRRSSRSGTSAAPSTMRWTRRASDRREPAAELARWRREARGLLRGRHAARPAGPGAGAAGRRSSTCRAALRGADRRRRDGSRHPRRYETFDDLYEYCIRVASAVGLICLEIFGYRDAGVAAVRDRSRRRAAADQHPARRAGGSGARPHLPSAGGSAAHGCTRSRPATRDGARRRRHRFGQVKALLRHQAQRARDYYARAARALPRRGRAQPGRRRDHGRDLPRDPRPHRAARLRRLLARRPRSHGRAAR